MVAPEKDRKTGHLSDELSSVSKGPDDRIQNCLQESFGHQSFRPLQRELIEADLRGKSIFTIQATGAGKSLCYQLPALLNPEGLTIVISPLIALIRDQVRSLESIEASVAFFDSDQSKEEREHERNKVLSGAAKLLYISPESVMCSSSLKMFVQREVRRVVVDEAHCISEWGHDFRPSYLKIPAIVKALGSPPITAMTATAPEKVAKEIVEILGLKNALKVHADIARPNLKFSIKRYRSSHEKNAELLDILGTEMGSGRAVVVYFTRIKTLEAVSSLLTEKGFRHGIYHGQMNRQEKQQVQEDFNEDDPPLLLATSAFGMGIDKANIRHIVLYGTPGSIEQYYQQAGRAGRDGEEARCTFLVSPYDFEVQREFVSLNNPSLRTLKNIYYELWRFVGEKKQDEAQPIVFVNPKRLYQSLNGQVNINRIISALAMLQEYGMIERTGRVIRLLTNIEDIKANGFPITKSLIRPKLKGDAARVELIRYLIYGAKDPYATMIDYFSKDGIYDEALAWAKENPYSSIPPHKSEILEGLSVVGCYKRSLVRVLAGELLPKHPCHGVLSHLSKDEIRLEIKALMRSGHLLKTSSKVASLVKLSKKAEEELQYGFISSLEVLKKAYESPEAFRALKAIFRDWANPEFLKLLKTASEKVLTDDFIEFEFTVFEKKMTGGQLLAYLLEREKASKLEQAEVSGFLCKVFDVKKE